MSEIFGIPGPNLRPDTDEALSFIDYELPEIKVLDFSSEEIENRKDPNILIVQTVYNFKQNFSRFQGFCGVISSSFSIVVCRTV